MTKGVDLGESEMCGGRRIGDAALWNELNHPLRPSHPPKQPDAPPVERKAIARPGNRKAGFEPKPNSCQAAWMVLILSKQVRNRKKVSTEKGVRNGKGCQEKIRQYAGSIRPP